MPPLRALSVRMGKLGLRIAGILASSVLVWSGVAQAVAPELSSVETARLLAGQQIVREDTVETARGRYIGGAAYVLISASPEEVSRVFDNVRSYRQILPCTRWARWVGLSRMGDMLVEMEQGNAIASGRYTLRIHRDIKTGSASTIRFSLDRRFSHDIADASGFFHIEPTEDGRTLLTYVVMVDLGPGLFQRLFENRIRQAALSAPVLIRSYLESRILQR